MGGTQKRLTCCLIPQPEIEYCVGCQSKMEACEPMLLPGEHRWRLWLSVRRCPIDGMTYNCSSSKVAHATIAHQLLYAATIFARILHERDISSRINGHHRGCGGIHTNQFIIFDRIIPQNR